MVTVKSDYRVYHLVHTRNAADGFPVGQGKLRTRRLFDESVLRLRSAQSLSCVWRVSLYRVDLAAVFKIQLNKGLALGRSVLAAEHRGGSDVSARRAVQSEDERIENGRLACARVAGDKVKSVPADLGKVDAFLACVRTESGYRKFKRFHSSTSLSLVWRFVFFRNASLVFRVFGDLKHLPAVFLTAACAFGYLVTAEKNPLGNAFTVRVKIVYLNGVNGLSAVGVVPPVVKINTVFRPLEAEPLRILTKIPCLAVNDHVVFHILNVLNIVKVDYPQLFVVAELSLAPNGLIKLGDDEKRVGNFYRSVFLVRFYRYIGKDPRDDAYNKAVGYAEIRSVKN